MFERRLVKDRVIDVMAAAAGTVLLGAMIVDGVTQNSEPSLPPEVGVCANTGYCGNQELPPALGQIVGGFEFAVTSKNP
jgi:hypothetical protein